MSGANAGRPNERYSQPGPSKPRAARPLPPHIYHAHEVPDPVPPRKNESQWKGFVDVSKRMYGPDPPNITRITTSELNLQANLDGPPKRPCLKKQPLPVLTMQEKARKLFIVDWWFPFALRIVQLVCCIVATARARNVLSYGTYTEVENACWILALVISACAVLCLPIMIHFEFWDRPSKWRASRRVLQLLVDLVFIIVNSVTMGFAFFIVGTFPPGHPTLRHRKLALAIMIVVALLAWVVTFLIHTLR